MEYDTVTAEPFYDEAIHLALLLDNKFLAEKITEEKQEYLSS